MVDPVAQMNKDDNLSPVRMPSGSIFYVHDKEVQYFNDRVKKYLSDNVFTNISDLQDVDRLIIAELLIWRWGVWVSQKRDYWGEAIDENVWQKAIREHSAEVRQLKKSLGIDKETRDKQRGEGSIDDYLQKLRQRALALGYTRDKQTAKAIELFMQLEAIITLYRNCDDKERAEQKATKDDVIQWIEQIAIPEFKVIDEAFRKNQRMWIREM